ncbi:ubiquitin carboxyl-terminal hydrolase 36-like isoform X1 [Thrips palmi]|uniref:Ubiquitin carboxyl-terminal hydrolase 36 n=1 Tax=Thrips palmi TaxID=161013 RepID=A0A6P9A0I5_THRPL|nr:ubiquitin carboxyl-terminal hydrolase 36-like isoform X1 [Thrips palmi]XP_034251241.1 ubiquitin carboxyl-terminal hydrolase 36-like isoform X1 [Thrips palmi]XP_034251242.1 ubiquitin carboxyl-terminal hydrolase 36-like isoform X1 [Thrips palmi]XP_034251243.1 ubiquitin carboxyl-terminal hydrolase 36-like isoform X1 [Thrips palmi]
MPSTTDAVSAGLRLSLAGVSRKVGAEANGDIDNLDSSLAAGNKLTDITKHLVEYESADNQQSNTQNLLKSKYIVLDTKVAVAPSFNRSITNGSKGSACANGSMHNGNKLANNGNGNSLPFGSQLNGVKGVTQNGLSYANVNGFNNKNSNGMKKLGCNGASKANGFENGYNKQTANCDSKLPDPKVVLYQPEKVSLGWRGKFRPGAGMVNLGNTCYLNATLQALFHVPAFVEWLSKDSDHMKRCEQLNGPGFGECITCAMARTYQLSQNTAIVKPHLITNKLKMICRHMSHGSQEDAHEFMRHLLENMEKAYLVRCKAQKLDAYSKETTPINQIFGGYMRTEVTCLKCNYASITFQHFQDLILDIRKVSKVEEAMHHYFMRERLDGENSYKCEKCKCGVPATKKYSIERPPKVLCIQLKRFNVMGVKLPKPVEHRIQMDLKKHVHPQSSYAKLQSLPYRLISMVTHVGPSSGCGHYTAIAQCSSKTYHQFDDTHVHPIQMSSVLNNCAYILIYEMEPEALRLGPKSVATSSISSMSAISSINHNVVNGVPKNVQTPGGLPSVKDRDRVMFGMTPPKPACAQPRLVMHQKRPEDNGSLVSPMKSIISNGSCNKESHLTNSNGPLQVVANGKHSGPSIVKDKSNSLGIVKLSDSVSCSQSTSVGKATEPEKKSIGPLVPYDYDDDSSSRDSSLSPPLNDDQAVLTVKATTPSDWQVTNSSGLRSPSIHSESSNHSVASATGSNWNVTEKQTLTGSGGSKSVTTLKVNDRKLKEHSPQTICYSSDTELESQAVNSAGKCDIRAKSVERELDIGCTATSSKHSLPNKKGRVRRSSLSSESDSSSSSKLLKKKAKVNDKIEDRSGSKPNSVNGSQIPSLVEGTKHISGENGKHTITTRPSSSSWNGDANSSTVNDLLKMSHQGFGNDRVASWNGDQSQVERTVEEERQTSWKRSRDEYETELDRGRVKKVKNDNRYRPYPTNNPFQQRSSGGVPFNNHRKYHNHSSNHYHYFNKNRPNPNGQRKWQQNYHKNSVYRNYRY